MGFTFLLFQSLFNIDFIRVVFTYALLTLGWTIVAESSNLLKSVVSIVIFSVLSFMLDRFSDSAFKWLLVLLAAGLLLI